MHKQTLNIILNHENGWTNITGKNFNHTILENSDYVYIFASPETTDELCFPLETNGIYSCRNESEIVTIISDGGMEHQIFSTIWKLIDFI